MPKIPKDPEEIFQDITNDYKELFGDDLVSIILYGSAAGKDYRQGKSDINFMIVLSDEGIENIDRAFKTVKKWQKRKVAIPLFLTMFYVETSTDVFPIEYLNFQHNHVLVYGEDILEKLTFSKEFVRMQCEREIKGKLLLLRESFIESGGKSRILKEIINKSLPTFLAIFDALLFLKDIEVPEDKKNIIKLACENFSIDEDLFNKLLSIRKQEIKPDEKELNIIFKNYLKEIRSLSKLVDESGG